MPRESVEIVREVHEAINARDEETLVALGQMCARGRGSGVEVREARAWVWWLRDGKVIRHATFDDGSVALEAAGLEE